MNKLEFQPKQLCYMGNGDKIHIKRKNHLTTYCDGEIGLDIKTDAYGFTESYEKLCKNCLRNYKTENKVAPPPMRG